MRSIRVLVAASALAGLGGVAQGHAAALTASDILTQFNAVISNDFTSTSDVEGRLVVENLDGGASFYMPRGTAAPSSFGAVNAITVASGVNANIDNGGNVNVQGTNLGHFNLNGGGHIVDTPTFSISDFTTPLTALTTQLAGLTMNSVVNATDPNNFTFVETPDATGMAVFNLSASLLSTARNLVFTGDASTIIIDVTGASYTDGTNFNASNYLNQHIIWVFPDATSLSFQGWHGAVLAPDATVTNSSAMEGDLFAENFDGNGELHDFTFAGTLPETKAPEPASLALLGIGLLGLGWVRRTR